VKRSSSEDLLRELGDQLRSGISKTLGANRVGRVGPERRADDRATRRQRPPRSPDVQRRDVPVPDRLLPPRVGADPLDGQIDFDQALGISRHVCSQVLKNGGRTGPCHAPSGLCGLMLFPFPRAMPWAVMLLPPSGRPYAYLTTPALIAYNACTQVSAARHRGPGRAWQGCERLDLGAFLALAADVQKRLGDLVD
jgi:hypothetical protein